VVRNVRYPSSLEKADRYIVVSVTTKLNWAVGNSLIVTGFKGAGIKPSARRFRTGKIQRILTPRLASCLKEGEGDKIKMEREVIS
jgi:hypothetical protein